MHEMALELRAIVASKLTGALGISDPRTLTAQLNLASTFDSLGRHEEAVKLGETILRLASEVLGDSHRSA